MLLALKKQQHKNNMSHNGKACKRFLENIPKRKKNNLTPPNNNPPPKLHYKHIKEPRSYRKQANSPQKYPSLNEKIINAKKY